MSKYVKLEDVLALKRMSVRDNLSIYSIDAYNVEMMRPADVRENTYGEWIAKGDCVECSECGFLTEHHVTFKFCPMCAATMKGIKNEEL